jgi:hypothetical protein
VDHRPGWLVQLITYAFIGGVIVAGLALFSSPAGPDDLPAPTPWATVSVPPVAPYTGPVTVCADGWVSHSVGRGTCSHHGGER